MKSFKAGFSRSDVTPQMGVRLGGYGIPERPAESVHDNLYSSALVLEHGTIRCAIISLDWTSITEATTETIKKGINAKTNIPLDNIIVCAIHTHSAPNVMFVPGWGDAEQEYIDSIMQAILESVVQAAKNLSPAKLGVGTIQSQVGVNRRTVHEDGHVGFEGNINGSYDPTMTVVRIVDMKDSPITTVIHYGAHNTAWGAARIVSRDWAGVMLDRLESQSGSPAMFINGAIGDVGPRTNQYVGNGKFSAGTGDGLEAVLEVGYRAATDALKCFFSINSFDETPVLKSTVADITIPVKQLPPLTEVIAKLEELKAYENAWGEKKCQYEYYRRVFEAHKQPPRTFITIESRIIAFGEVAFISLPGEPFSSISLRLRKGSLFPYTLLVSSANGCIVYIPDVEARKIGGYEVTMESAVHTYLPVENSDEFIVETGIKKLNELYNME